MRKKTGRVVIMIALWFSLFGAMFGSVKHVAWSFSTLSEGMFAGYVQAIALDIGIAALTFGIQMRRMQRRDVKLLWAGVILFSLISTYANLLYGFEHLTAIKAAHLAQYRPFIMAAVLPLMVIFLSEVVSDDVKYATEEREKAERKQRRKARAATSDTAHSTPDNKATGPTYTYEEAVQALVSTLQERPDIPIAQLAREIRRSRTQTYTYLAELQESGKLKKVDDGYQVVSTNGTH